MPTGKLNGRNQKGISRNRKLFLAALRKPQPDEPAQRPGGWTASRCEAGRSQRERRYRVPFWDSGFPESGHFSAKTRSNRIQSRSSGTKSGSSAAQSSSGGVPSRSGGAICPSRGAKSRSNVIRSAFLRHSTGLRRPPMVGGWGWAAPSPEQGGTQCRPTGRMPAGSLHRELEFDALLSAQDADGQLFADTIRLQEEAEQFAFGDPPVEMMANL